MAPSRSTSRETEAQAGKADLLESHRKSAALLCHWDPEPRLWGGSGEEGGLPLGPRLVIARAGGEGCTSGVGGEPEERLRAWVPREPVHSPRKEPGAGRPGLVPSSGLPCGFQTPEGAPGEARELGGPGKC